MELGEPQLPRELSCKYCKVSVTSAMALHEHVMGQKHKTYLKRTAPSMVPEAWGLQYFLDTYLSDEPILGLEYIVELQVGDYSYTCQLCGLEAGRKQMIGHLTGPFHLKIYLDKHYPTVSAYVNELSNKMSKLKALQSSAHKIHCLYGRKIMRETDVPVECPTPADVAKISFNDFFSVKHDRNHKESNQPSEKSDVGVKRNLADESRDPPGKRIKPSSEGRDLPSERRNLPSERHDLSNGRRDLSRERRCLSRERRDLSRERRHPSSRRRDLSSERRDLSRERRDLSPKRHNHRSERRDSPTKRRDHPSQKSDRPRREMGNFEPTDVDLRRCSAPSQVTKSSAWSEHPERDSVVNETWTQMKILQFKDNDQFFDYLRNYQIQNDEDATFLKAIIKNFTEAITTFQKTQAEGLPQSASFSQPAPTHAVGAVEEPHSHCHEAVNDLVPSTPQGADSSNLKSEESNRRNATEIFFSSIKNMAASEVSKALEKIASTNPAFKGIDIPGLIRYLQQTGRLATP